jgi:Flp pilus assembly protein TadD
MDREMAPEFIAILGEWRGIEVAPEARKLMALRFDGTPASLRDFVKIQKDNGKSVISPADVEEFRGTFPNDWEKDIYDKQISPYPARRYLFAALSLLYQARVSPYKYLAVRLAERLWPGPTWGRGRQIARAVKDLAAWVEEREGLLSCPEAYLEGKADLRENVPLLTDLLLAASREKGRAAELLHSLFNLAVALQTEVANPAEAERLYNRVIQLDPNLAQPYNNLGTLLAEQPGRLAEAEAAYRRAIELDPNDAAAYNNLGALLAEQPSHLAEAEAAYRRAIELNPNYAAAYYNLGVLLAEQPSRLAEAEAAYRRTIQLNPNYAAAYYNLGVLLAEQPDRLAEAEAAYRRAIELNPNYATAYNNLGNLLAKQPDRLAEAEAAYKKALELGTPDDARVYNNLGNLYYNQERYEEAVAAHSKATELDPNQAAYWNGLGNALHALKQYQEAAEAYSQAVAAEPEEAMYLRNRADTYIRLGRLEEAEEDLEKARELDPENAYLFARYGQLYLWREEFDQAVAMFREAQGRELSEAEVQFNLALATLCQERLEEAREEYKQGIEMADKEDWEEAIEDLEKMLAGKPGLEGAEEIMEMLWGAKTQGKR